MARFEISSLSRVPFVTRSFHCISPTHASRRSSFPPSFHPSFEIQPYPPLSFSLVCPIRVTGRGGSTANRILAISSPLAIIILVHGKLSGCTFVSTPWRLATLGNTWVQTIMYEKERKLFRINLVQILKYVKHSENKRNAFLSYIFERIVWNRARVKRNFTNSAKVYVCTKES